MVNIRFQISTELVETLIRDYLENRYINTHLQKVLDHVINYDLDNDAYIADITVEERKD